MADLVTFSQDVARRLMRMLTHAERGFDDTPNRKKRRPIDDGGGSGGLYLFTLATVNCLDRTATGTVSVAPCGVSLPTGVKTIADDMGCFLTGNPAILVGMKCWCQYSTDQYGCIYSIVSMCCADATC